MEPDAQTMVSRTSTRVISRPAVVAARVRYALRGHPLVEEMEEVGTIEVQHGRLAVTATFTPAGTGLPLRAEMQQAEWWVARAPHWPERLAHRLAAGLREQWDARPPS